jgi:hypothetical protein
MEKIDDFQSLEDAIQERYLPQQKQSYISDELLLEARDALSAPFMKVVGMEKLSERQSKLMYTEDVTICYSTINEAGKLPHLDNLKTLCLQSSCISNWKTVYEIVTQIPSLRILDLSANRLQLPDENANDEKFMCENIETLILNSCDISQWKEVLRIGEIFLNLRELSLKQNKIKSITECPANESFQKLETLTLGENEISDFNEILKLSTVPNLKELWINNNKITKVVLPYCEYLSRLNIFGNLETFNCRHNPIKDEVQMFNELDKLPSLTRLSYISQKSFQSEGGDKELIDTFLQAVGMIEKLISFNRSEIEKIHRNDAMYEMWKKFAAEWMKAGEQGEPKMEEFYLAHRCYPRLIKKYGNPDQFIVQPNRKRITTIEIQFKNVTNLKMYHKKVPLAMTVRSLVGLVYKIAELHTCPGMDLKSMKLYYIDAYNNNIKVYLDNLSKSLDFYSLQNGDTIYIDK